MEQDVHVDPAYGYTAHLDGVSFDDARVRVPDALKAQGFGILTEIDVKATIKAKLNRDFRRYVILGTRNPELAHRALETELAVGLLLRCNVCLWEEDGGTVVSIAKPAAIFEIVKSAALQPLAGEVDRRLHRAIEQIGTTTGKSERA